MPVEMFLGVFPIPGRIADYARMIERDGWDGLAVTDSQTNNGDAFCALSAAAGDAVAARRRLNTYIRHWTMHANARQTLQSADDELVERIKSRTADLTDDFVEGHAVAGTSEYVAGRPRQMLALGLDH